MEPINQAERKAAIVKLTIFLVLSVGLVILPFVFYTLIPDTEAYVPPTAVNATEEIDSGELAAIRERLLNLAERMKPVNITFLVDATEGMGKYLPAVAQSATTINENYQADIEAACYRDAAEGVWLYMTNSMVGDEPAAWIQSLDTESKFDQDEPEALYYGLKRTLESPHLSPQETNILILVGDAGNHAQEDLTDVSPADIVQLLKAKNCHFAVFQARNPTSNASYADFSSQMMGEIFTPLKNTLDASILQEKDSLDQFGLYYTLQGGTFLSLYATNPAQSLPANVLSEKINSFVAQVMAPARHITTIEALGRGEDVAVEPQLAEYLLQNQFTSEEIEMISSP